MGRKERERKGYGWAVGAGVNAALGAISAKLISSYVVKFVFVIIFNVTMWVCYTNSLLALSSLQATVINFATNFLFSALSAFFLFGEQLSPQWFAGALLIVTGVFLLTKSTIDTKKVV